MLTPDLINGVERTFLTNTALGRKLKDLGNTPLLEDFDAEIERDRSEGNLAFLGNTGSQALDGLHLA